jgi:hypothetical protein
MTSQATAPGRLPSAGFRSFADNRTPAPLTPPRQRAASLPARPAPGQPPPHLRASGSLAAWGLRHKVLSTMMVATLVLVAGTGVATLIFTQNVVTTTTAAAPVIFQNGADYAGINAKAFATLTFGTTATSATLAISGVPGAASVSLTNVLKLDNTDASHSYSVTLSRSAAPNAAITSFQVTVKNGATTLATWDAASAASSSAFTIPASTALDISIVTVITDGTALASLGSFTIGFALS